MIVLMIMVVIVIDRLFVGDLVIDLPKVVDLMAMIVAVIVIVIDVVKVIVVDDDLPFAPNRPHPSYPRVGTLEHKHPSATEPKLTAASNEVEDDPSP